MALLMVATIGCDGEEPVATPKSEPSTAVEIEAGAEKSEPEAEPEPDPRPDDAACSAFVDHMTVVTAQSLGVPAKNLFTAGECSDAVEHCKRYAHANLRGAAGAAISAGELMPSARS